MGCSRARTADQERLGCTHIGQTISVVHTAQAAAVVLAGPECAEGILCAADPGTAPTEPPASDQTVRGQKGWFGSPWWGCRVVCASRRCGRYRGPRRPEHSWRCSPASRRRAAPPCTTRPLPGGLDGVAGRRASRCVHRRCNAASAWRCRRSRGAARSARAQRIANQPDAEALRSCREPAAARQMPARIALSSSLSGSASPNSSGSANSMPMTPTPSLIESSNRIAVVLSPVSEKADRTAGAVSVRRGDRIARSTKTSPGSGSKCLCSNQIPNRRHASVETRYWPSSSRQARSSSLHSPTSVVSMWRNAS